MKLSNLSRIFRRSALYRSSFSPTRRGPLTVESLEDRVVPTFNVTPYTFSMPTGTFHAATESLRTGTFEGIFADARTGINIAVTGQLQAQGKHVDSLHFSGSGTQGGETEQVTFNGKLHLGQSPLLTGTLTETVTTGTHLKTTHSTVDSRGSTNVLLLDHVFKNFKTGVTDPLYSLPALNWNWQLDPHIFTIDPIVAKYASLGGTNSFLGAPTSSIQTTPDGVGEFQDYQNGVIYYSPFSGAHEVHGLILLKWESLGMTNFGYPTTDETTTPDGMGRFNHFVLANGQVSAIDWTPATGAHEIQGAIATYFASQGWENVGEATSDEIDLTATGAAYNRFERSLIFGWLRFTIDWTPQNGASLVPGTSYTDMKQGAADTCWIDASIAEEEYTEMYHNTDLSQRITYLGNDWYSVSLFNCNDPNNRSTGGYHPETQFVYFDGSTTSADASYDAAHPSTSWTVIMQRAIIQAVAEWDPSQSITKPHSGTADDALQIITGRESTWVSAQDGSVQQDIINAVQAGQDVCLDTKGSGTHTLVNFHYYAVLSADNQGVTLYNPWGSTVTVSWTVVNQDGNAFVIN
jgi:hypothetical protein